LGRWNRRRPISILFVIGTGFDPKALAKFEREIPSASSDIKDPSVQDISEKELTLRGDDFPNISSNIPLGTLENWLQRAPK
jgi:hypothetical protein